MSAYEMSAWCTSPSHPRDFEGTMELVSQEDVNGNIIDEWEYTVVVEFYCDECEFRTRIAWFNHKKLAEKILGSQRK